ncbi:hypothetical protein [Phormidium tenue]|uniref:Uncharacterized protein n=1 Tax=Phormidium tenue NIES-30 TaxID=549789 RepID=A0A1U7IZY5_9CYAN|nr:hypothetical protein [Phormidium tenue]MBD2231688.1 hypothetical protein [Phormidium tenue FACHB-1052]OKH44812.1 hypothetical protein NIES30_21510 [Phormidium tenue NIES-30]
MIDAPTSPRRVPISPNFFCDGGGYLLTSSSLGGSGLDPTVLSQTILDSTPATIEPLLRQGVCIPLAFDGDCALDRSTLFVLGDLTEPEQSSWLGRFTWKLAIPCGKLVLLCGGGYADDLVHAISGRPADQHYEVFQVIEVPPATYRVDVYAYATSMTARIHFNDNPDNQDFDDLDDAYDEAGNPTLVSYIIQLSPLMGELPLPGLDEQGWCYQFRRTGI